MACRFTMQPSSLTQVNCSFAGQYCDQPSLYCWFPFFESPLKISHICILLIVYQGKEVKTTRFGEFWKILLPGIQVILLLVILEKLSFLYQDVRNKKKT